MPSHAKMRTSLSTDFELAFPTGEIRLKDEFFTTLEEYLRRNAVIWHKYCKTHFNEEPVYFQKKTGICCLNVILFRQPVLAAAFTRGGLSTHHQGMVAFHG